jgi:hypothetical protein
MPPTRGQAFHRSVILLVFRHGHPGIGLSRAQAEKNLRVATEEAMRDDASLKARLWYITLVAGAWLVLGCGCILAIAVLGFAAHAAFGDEAQQLVLITLGFCGIACAFPGVATLWFRGRARKANRETVRPHSDPARLRRLSSQARPGGGLLLAQLAFAALTLPIIIEATR